MRTSTRLLLNSAANLAGGLLSAALALILTPVLVNGLDRSAFGVWQLAGPVRLYAPLILLGVSGAVTRFVASYLAREDYDSINAFVNTARAYFCFGTLVLVGIGIAVAVALPRGTNIDPSLHAATFWCVLILTVFQATVFAFGPTAAVLYSLERFDLIALTQVISRAVRLAGLVVAIWLFRPRPATGLLLVAVIMGATDAGPLIVQSMLSRRLCPPLRVDLRLARWEHVWPMIRFGLRTLLWTAVNILLPYTAFLVVGHYLSDADVGDYGIPERLLAFVSVLVGTVVD